MGLIPVDRIVGSVHRRADFGRDFKPQRRLSRSRMASLRSAIPDGGMPAIEAFEVGGAYQLRRDLRGHDETIDFDAAAARARELELPRSQKRHHLRESRRPLPRRGD